MPRKAPQQSTYERYGDRMQEILLDAANRDYLRATKRKLGIPFNKVINEAIAEHSKKELKKPKVAPRDVIQPHVQEMSEKLLHKPMSESQLENYLSEKILDCYTDLNWAENDLRTHKNQTA